MNEERRIRVAESIGSSIGLQFSVGQESAGQFLTMYDNELLEMILPHVVAKEQYECAAFIRSIIDNDLVRAWYERSYRNMLDGVK